MARNTRFEAAREPLRQHPSLQLDNDRIHGPVASLNPTQAHFTHVAAQTASGSDSEHNADNNDPNNQVRFRWTSRNNRKGRHALVITSADVSNNSYHNPAPTSGIKSILLGIRRMATNYPVWDVSYLVAVVFTLGSVVWVINAFFSFLPTLRGGRQSFAGEVLDGGGITAFVGATIFEVGSVLLMLEAVNENRAGCFGWAVERLYDDRFNGGEGGEKGPVTRVRADLDACSHHHRNRKNLVGKSLSSRAGSESKDDPGSNGKSWVWRPSWHDLRTHYLHDLGFLACSAQMFGATIFWISGFTALPGIFNHMSQGLIDGIYWTPQVVGGSGFIVSGTLFMIETQKVWYLPALDVLGWHIGLWNLIGGIGFTLCPAFGYAPASWAQYQASCSTFWGSWAFLIGSTLQWYESLDKHPVEVEKASP